FCSSCYSYKPPCPPRLHSSPTRPSSDLGTSDDGVYVVEPAGHGRFASRHSVNTTPAGDCHVARARVAAVGKRVGACPAVEWSGEDRKSTRLNSSHGSISYAVFCLKKKKY